MSSWVALDWGTTNFRAYLMDKDDIVDQISTQEGMKFVNQKILKKHLLEIYQLGIKNLILKLL